jgi:DNA repair protein RadD
MRAGRRRVLIQSPTGSGKTAMTAEMLTTAAARGLDGFFIVHRRELVKQSIIFT